MSESSKMRDVDALSEPITLDQIKGKALAIRDEVKVEIRQRARERRSQLVVAGVVAIVLVIGIAYRAGSRSARCAAGPHPR